MLKKNISNQVEKEYREKKKKCLKIQNKYKQKTKKAEKFISKPYRNAARLQSL